MKILALGDIFGRPGRQAIRELLPKVICENKIDFVIANAENAAGGRGLTPKIADELFESPIDVMTAGNHIWEHDAIHPYFDSHPILRPYNVHGSLPGRGVGIFAGRSGERIAVASLQGLIFMDEKGKKAEDPFKGIDAIISEVKNRVDIIIVDFHAEATSEKRALSWYADGRITALLGTHTHVQTADEHIMPGGTAYISDLGMTGPHDSVIGLDPKVALHRFLTGDKKKFGVAESGVRLEGVILDIDSKNFKMTKISRVQRSLIEASIPI